MPDFFEKEIDSITGDILAEHEFALDNYSREDLDDGEGNYGLDCQLQFFEGSFNFHVGDSQYITDSRGYWEYGFINLDWEDKDEAARQLAEELLEGVEGEIYINRDEDQIIESLKKGEKPDDCLYGLDLTGLQLKKAFFNDIDLSFVNLSKAKLFGCAFEDSRFVGANLEKATLINANLIRADFTRANLVGTQFVSANLERAKFTSANCKTANFKKAICRDATAYKADFTNAKFDNADLSDAGFVECDFQGATFAGANIKNAVFANCTNLDLTGATHE